MINIIKKLPFSRSNGTMPKDKISSLIIHHDAQFVPSKGYNTLERIKQHAKLHISKGYSHLAYHYVIDNVGDIYQCLPETEVGYHAGNLAVNRSSIAVCLHGNFEVQKPTKRQIEALQRFIKWMTTERPDLPLVVRQTVKAHRDIKATACPGRNLYSLLPKL